MTDTGPHVYLSTACLHEQDGQPELHASCRVTCKFCGAPCSCPGHPGGAEEAQPAAWVDQARDVARALLAHAALGPIPLPAELVRRIATDPNLFWLDPERGEQPPGTWRPPGADPGVSSP